MEDKRKHIDVLLNGIQKGELKLQVLPGVIWCEERYQYIEGCMGRIGPDTKCDENGHLILPPWEYHKLTCGKLSFQLTNEIKDQTTYYLYDETCRQLGIGFSNWRLYEGKIKEPRVVKKEYEAEHKELCKKQAAIYDLLENVDEDALESLGVILKGAYVPIPDHYYETERLGPFYDRVSFSVNGRQGTELWDALDARGWIDQYVADWYRKGQF